MASVGSAVGLGNIFRFPALAVKYGLIYIIVYIFLLFAVGLPLLTSELALGRKYGGSVVKSLSAVNPKYRFIGWLCCADSFIIMTYYCVLFSFVILAAAFSFRLAEVTPQTAGEVFPDYLYPDGFPLFALLFFLFAWATVILCFGGAERLGKISTVGVIFSFCVLGAMALLSGFSHPEALVSFCRFDSAVLLSAEFWRDSLGQVFFSLSIMVGVMPAYGSFLSKNEKLASCGAVIALFDLAVSLAATVIYATIAQDNTEGLLACFSVYPEAFSRLGNPAFGAAVSFLFYLSLALLCLDSVFSYLKSISHSIFDRFGGNETVFAILPCLVSAFFGLFLLGKRGKAAIDLLDGRIVPMLTLVIGLAEVCVFARLSRSDTLTAEINRGQKKGVPKTFYKLSIKILSPLVIIILILSEILF